MLCYGFEPWAAGWKEQTDPQSYGGRNRVTFFREKPHRNMCEIATLESIQPNVQ